MSQLIANTIQEALGGDEVGLGVLLIWLGLITQSTTVLAVLSNCGVRGRGHNLLRSYI